MSDNYIYSKHLRMNNGVHQLTIPKQIVEDSHAIFYIFKQPNGRIVISNDYKVIDLLQQCVKELGSIPELDLNKTETRK